MMALVRRWRFQSAADKLVTQTWVVFILLVIVSATLAVVLISNSVHNSREDTLGSNQSTDLTCIANYENASQRRTAILTPLSTARGKALRTTVNAEHSALSYALSHPNGTKAEAEHEIALLVAWNVASASFQLADDAYNKAVKDHPVPDPVFKCSDRLHSKATKSPTPSGSPTGHR